MAENKEQYFNFPIQLLEGFLDNAHKCLNNISDYAFYVHSFKLEFNTEIDKLNASADYFGLKLNNPHRNLENAEMLYDSISARSPKVGINLEMWKEFYFNDKSEFEKVCLLGFLAIRSIVQNKAYCKITNRYWLSRMDGNACSVSDNHELSGKIKKYNNEYQTKKIKTELVLNWNLVTYSRFTRGFYVSFKLDINQLVYEAEKRRKSTLIKQHKFYEKLALEKALARLEGRPP